MVTSHAISDFNCWCLVGAASVVCLETMKAAAIIFLSVLASVGFVVAYLCNKL